MKNFLIAFKILPNTKLALTKIATDFKTSQNDKIWPNLDEVCKI